MGDGTTTVVILAGEFLKEAKPYVEDGVHPRVRFILWEGGAGAGGGAALAWLLGPCFLLRFGGGERAAAAAGQPAPCSGGRWARNGCGYALRRWRVRAPKEAAAPAHPLRSAAPPNPHNPLPQSIIKSYRAACALAVELIKAQAVSLEGRSDAEKRDLLRKCAMTSMNSKLARLFVF